MENLLIFMSIYFVIQGCITIRFLYLIVDAMYSVEEVDNEGDQ